MKEFLWVLKNSNYGRNVMRNVISAKSYLMCMAVLILLMATSISCTKTVPGMIVTPYYASVVVQENNTASKIPVSIRVNPIEFDTPGSKTNGGATVLKLFPLLSLIPVSDQNYFNINLAPFEKITREPGEIEKILTEELNKTSLFNEVTFEGVQKDYDIQGKVDFTLDLNSHMSGFGIFFGIASLLFLPTATYNYKCEAHFEVVSTNDSSIVFSKDYFAKERYTLGVFYGNILKSQKLYGKKVFPVIVEEFINDLKEKLKQKV